MALYRINRIPATVRGTNADLFKVGFGDPATGEAIVREVEETFKTMDLPGGKLALINGPASLPVAVVLAHWLGHRYSALGVFDPKLSGYIVAQSHGADLRPGDVIPAAEVAAQG